MSKEVYAEPTHSVITRVNEKNKILEDRIKHLKAELDKIGNKESAKYEQVQRRIASLTRGKVTVHVGGRTPIETNEKIYRYEDAINATRVAMKNGYLVGGGIATIHAMTEALKHVKPEFRVLFAKLCEANLRQILINCGGNWNSVIEQVLSSKTKTHGYNALTGKVEDLMKIGIIEPFAVVENVVKNSISIANAIISSRYIIVNKIEKENGQSK